MGCAFDNYRVRARTPAGFARMAARAVALGGLTMLGTALPARAEGPPAASDLAVSASRIEADVRFLADDLLEGREAGTRGYDLAALYVASLNQPIHWPAAARLAYVNYRIGLAIGNDPQRPTWKPGDFFGEKFGR